MSGRVLKRPLGGWGARQWRREVTGWLWLAFLVLAAGATCATVYRIMDFAAQAGSELL